MSTFERKWPDARQGPWALRVIFEQVDGRPAVVGVELYAKAVRPERPWAEGEFVPDGFEQWGEWPANVLGGHPVPISAEGVRLPLGRLLQEARASREGQIADVERRILEPATHLRSRGQDLYGPRPRRGVLTAEHFRQVADTYTAALAKGANPTQAVATAWFVSDSTAAKWVARARRPPYQFLPPTTQGRSAGGDENDSTDPTEEEQ